MKRLRTLFSRKLTVIGLAGVLVLALLGATIIPALASDSGNSSKPVATKAAAKKKKKKTTKKKKPAKKKPAKKKTVSVQGKQGPAGPAGPAGAAGANGADGVSNVPGPQGHVGPAGPTGAAGARGADGVSNVPGPTGPAGPQGRQGDEGDIGPPGPTGLTGPVGPQGLQGEAGKSLTNVTVKSVRNPSQGTINEKLVTQDVACDQGQIAITGGVYSDSNWDHYAGSTPPTVATSQPLVAANTPTGWRAAVYGGNSHDWSFTVYAVCGTMQ